MNHRLSVPAEVEPSVADKKRHAVIRQHLARIRESHAFCNSPRAKEFLSYVVEQAVEGHADQLKERSIGVNLFHRDPTYITGDDSIVRVKAAEVRKRLAQFYGEEEPAPEIRIEIPVGSYIPRFHWRTTSEPAIPPAQTPSEQPIAPRSKLPWWRIAVAVLVLTIIGIAVASMKGKHVQQRSEFDEFWAPVFTTGQPVLICLSSPELYYPSPSVFAEAAKAHPGLYNTQLERAFTPVKLEPNTPLQWKDIEPRSNIFVNKVHVYNVAILSALFERIHKTSQVKVGSDFSYNDLQNSPAVLLGAFDNPWSVRMAAELPFYFHDDQEPTIVEKVGEARVWQASNTKDFAIVARLLNSKTGQFQVILGGINIAGTEAAGKLVTRQEVLNAAIRSAPADWQSKNLEFVIETDLIDGSDSSTRVVAVKTW